MPDGLGRTAEMADFVPGPNTAREFRSALGQFATGVTIVTTETPTGPIGITANSFSSVSLDPPLVMWCPAKASKRFPFYKQARHFAIHVIGCDQTRIAERFARAGDDFERLEVAYNEHSVPLIEGCAARFECKTEQIYDAGDHAIMVGLVERATTFVDADALIFAAGKYGRLTGLD